MTPETPNPTDLGAKRRGAQDFWKRKHLPPSPPPAEGWEPCFVRFGDLPENGFSRNHSDGSLEKGTSVFRAYATPEGEYVIDLEGSVLLALAFSGLMLKRRPAFLVEGVEVGTGYGGEPLLRKITRCEPLPVGSRVRPSVEIPARYSALMAIGRLIGKV